MAAQLVGRMTYPRFLSIVSVTLALLWSSVFASPVSPQVSITANGTYQQVTWPLPDNKTGLVAVQAVGSFGGGTIQFYGSLDNGANYFPVGSAFNAAGTQTFNWRDGTLYYTLSGATSPSVTLTFFSVTGAPASAGGGGGGGASGSVTAAGVNGLLAQAVQGITGGVPINVTEDVDATTSGTLTGSGNFAVSCLVKGTVTFQVTGTWTGSIVTECTVNGTDWISTTFTSIPSGNSASTFSANSGGQVEGIATLAITGVSANQVVYVVTVPSATTFTVALTPGGTGVQVTASGTATAYRILKQIRLQTTALPVTNITLPTPIRSAPNVAISLLSSATQTGTVYFDTEGYYGF